MKMAPVILSQHYTEIFADDGTRSTFFVIALAEMSLEGTKLPY